MWHTVKYSEYFFRGISKCAKGILDGRKMLPILRMSKSSKDHCSKTFFEHCSSVLFIILNIPHETSKEYSI